MSLFFKLRTSILTLPLKFRTMSSYTVRQIGQPDTPEYKAYILENHKPVSAFHDIPLIPKNAKDKNVFNMIVEVPRWTNAKLEISKEASLNPIVQDTKKDKLRYVSNLFPYHGYIHNYGALPQTWEDPHYKHEGTKAFGDSDPLDVCEIGESIGFPGEVRQVKVLGCLAMIDEGCTDWKLIVISLDDRRAHLLNDIADVEKHLPGLLDATRSWFKNYKIPDGKPENVFAYNGEFKDRDFALNVVKECYESWEILIKGKTDPEGISLDNATLEGTPGFKKDISKTIPEGKELDKRVGGPVVEKVFYLGKL